MKQCHKEERKSFRRVCFENCIFHFYLVHFRASIVEVDGWFRLKMVHSVDQLFQRTLLCNLLRRDLFCVEGPMRMHNKEIKT